MSSLWSPFGGLITLQSLREQAARWNLRGEGPTPQAHGQLQTSAHRAGYPDQPSWLTTGTWLDLIESIAAELAKSPLTVQLLAGDGRCEAPAWAHLRFEALPRSHGWSLAVRRPGATVANLKSPGVDTAEIVDWVRRAVTGDDAFWQGADLGSLPPAPPELPVWEGLSREPGGTWRLGYFRSTLSWDPGDLSDLVDLTWAAGLSRMWLVPGPTLVFRGIPAERVSDWRDWLRSKRRVSQRPLWHRVVRTVEATEQLNTPHRELLDLLEGADQWPSHPVVLGTEHSDRREGLFTPGHTLVLATATGWRWRSADGDWAGEGDSAALSRFLFTSPPTKTPPTPLLGTSGSAAGNRTCRSCHNVYSPAWGDPLAAIPPGVLFEHLPGYWKCPVCGASPSMYAQAGGDHARDADPH